MRRAPIFSRFVALLIDMLIIELFSGAICAAALSGYYAGSGELTFLGVFGILFLSAVFSLLVFVFYFTYLTMGQGMTIGKRAVGIQVVRRSETGATTDLGFFRSLVRTLAYILSASVLFLGFLMAFFFKGCTLHDIIAGTRVVVAQDGERS